MQKSNATYMPLQEIPPRGSIDLCSSFTCAEGMPVRSEWLSQYHWCDLDEVREYATQWIWRSNHERPNMALGGITPKQRLAMAA